VRKRVVRFAFYVHGFPGEGVFEDIHKPIEKSYDNECYDNLRTFVHDVMHCLRAYNDQIEYPVCAAIKNEEGERYPESG